MSSIRDWGLKIKVWLEEGLGQWGMAVLVVLVGLLSYGLDRLSVLEDARPAVLGPTSYFSGHSGPSSGRDV